MNELMLELLRKARSDESLKQKLIDTQNSAEPMAEFCRIATEAGFEMTVGDLLGFGQEYSDNMLKSCNGGATYPFDYLDDAYDMFFAAL